MILTDGKHLVSDKSAVELHAFAKRIGLKRDWFQEHQRHPHYDLTTQCKANRAIQEGAKLVTKKELVKRMVKP